MASPQFQTTQSGEAVSDSRFAEERARRVAERKGPRTTRAAVAARQLPSPVAAVIAGGAAAWPEFIDEYSDFILNSIRRIASDPDERMDIYTHVCVRLSADDCRRIKQFRGYGEQGSCQFTTWLATVVLNLGREWIRCLRGRRRLYRGVRRLPRVDRLVFQYHYWERLPAVQIARVLRWNHGLQVQDVDVERSLERIETMLPADHRWRILSNGRRWQGPVPLEDGSEDGPGHLAVLPAEQPDAVSRRSGADAIVILRSAVERLPPLERRALELRFVHEKNAREAAFALGIDNYKRVYELQARALVRLRRALLEAGVDLQDFHSDLDTRELLR